jgi:hypothetical protein
MDVIYRAEPLCDELLVVVVVGLSIQAKQVNGYGILQRSEKLCCWFMNEFEQSSFHGYAVSSDDDL